MTAAKRIRTLRLCARLIAMHLALAVPCVVSAQNTHTFDIPAQSLADSLRALATQAGVNVVFEPSSVRDKQAPILHGSYSVPEALNHLLNGSGLNARTTEGGSFVIELPLTGTGKSAGATARSQHLAQADRFSSLQAKDKSDDEKQTVAESAGSATDTDTKGIPEILVKGSRSSNADIRRTEDDIQPYKVFDSKDIEKSQATTLDEFFMKRLSMDTAKATVSQAADSPGVFQGLLNLRGLGLLQTLVLVDGRRLPSVSTGGNFGQPSIEGIPLAAVERIEVLATTASGIYGGNATGGVINIIMKKDYSGLNMRAQYSNVFDGDVAGRRFAANGGMGFDEGKTRLTFSAAHSTSDSLLVKDRDFLRRARAIVRENSYEDFKSMFGGAFNPMVGRTPNVCAALVFGSFVSCDSASNLTLDSTGQSLGSFITYVPVGYAGPQVDQGQALVANAGDFSIDAPDTGQTLMRSPEVNSLALSLRHNFGARFEAFLDLQGSRSASDMSANLGNLNNPIALPADSPANPFEQAIAVSLSVPGLSTKGESVQQSLQATAGLLVRLSQHWSATLESGWGRSRSSYRSQQPGFSLSSGLPPDVLSAIESNPLVDLNAHPLLVPTDLTDLPITRGGPYDNVLATASLRISGTALRLPAGPLRLAALLERREETSKVAFFDSGSEVSEDSRYLMNPRRWQHVSSYYLESTVPVVDAPNSRTFLQVLELQISARRDEYRTYSTSDTPTAASLDGPFGTPNYYTNEVASNDTTFGVRYSPVKSVILRASAGTGFVAPSLGQLTPLTNPINFPGSFYPEILDAKRGDTDIYAGVPNLQYQRFGGNPNLKPEKSRSWSAGMILTPAFIQGARVSLDYTSITKRDEFGTMAADFFMRYEELYPERVVRGPNLSTDPVGWAGPVVLLDASVVNIAATEMNALDIQLDYALPTAGLGDFHFGASATRNVKFTRQTAIVTPTVNYLGSSDGPLRWRGQFNVDWTHGPLTLSWNVQHYGSYAATYADPMYSAGANPAILRLWPSGVIPSQTYHDFMAQMTLDNARSALLSGVTVSLGIQNVFDTSPPFQPPTGAYQLGYPSTQGYSTYGSPLLRRFALTVEKRFGQ